MTKGSDSVTQTYDTRNRVTSRTVNGQTTYFVWDGWNLIEERDANGNQIRRYVHGAGVDEPLMMVDASGPLYYVQDGLGSVTALTDEYGAVLERYRYDAFGTVSAFDGSGDPMAGGPAAGNQFLYTGRECGRRRRGHMDDARSVSPEGRGRDVARPSQWIAEAGLYDYRNRVYSPVLGRFLQNDPIRFEAGDVNLYRYVGNSAVNFVDPDGLDRSVVYGGFGTFSSPGPHVATQIDTYGPDGLPNGSVVIDIDPLNDTYTVTELPDPVSNGRKTTRSQDESTVAHYRNLATAGGGARWDWFTKLFCYGACYRSFTRDLPKPPNEIEWYPYCP